MRRAVFFVLAVAAYLVAAKTHGRQLRLERELAGHWHVTFGGKNPDFVESLWRRERWIYWSLVAAFALLSIGYRRLGFTQPRSVFGLFFLHVALPLTFAFAIAGLASFVRLAGKLGEASPEWTRAALLGSGVWFATEWVVLSVLLVLAVRRG
jgi:hypothetical protein